MTEYGIIAGAALAVALICYLLGRAQGAAGQAALRSKLESDTEHFNRLLADRDQDYGKTKEHFEQARKQNAALQVDRDKALGQRKLQAERADRLEQQLNEMEEQLHKVRGRLEPLEAERVQLRDTNIELEAHKRKLEEQVQEQAKRLHALEEKLRAVLAERAQYHADGVASRQQAQEMQKRLRKQEDLTESAELSLAQIRTVKDELAQRLASAEGQLELVERLVAAVKGEPYEAPAAGADQGNPQAVDQLATQLKGLG